MNVVTVQQTTQGLVRYLQQAEPERLAAGGVAIGFDGRHHSRQFAAIAAAVCAAGGVPVWLFSELVPTPFVPAAVQQLVRGRAGHGGGAASGLLMVFGGQKLQIRCSGHTLPAVYPPCRGARQAS